MALTVQMQFESAVTEMYQDAFVGSSVEDGTTIIQFDLRKCDFHRALGTTSTIYWRKDIYHVDVHELSTFHNPIKYRFIVAQGYYLNAQNQRMSFTPDIQGVSTAQHMSKSIIRLSCYLAVACGVSLRHIALLFAVLFLIPISKSSMKRWIDDIGVHLPTQRRCCGNCLRARRRRNVTLTATTRWVRIPVIPATQSGAKLPPNPKEACHPIRTKAAPHRYPIGAQRRLG